MPKRSTEKKKSSRSSLEDAMLRKNSEEKNRNRLKIRIIGKNSEDEKENQFQTCAREQQCYTMTVLQILDPKF